MWLYCQWNVVFLCCLLTVYVISTRVTQIQSEVPDCSKFVSHPFGLLFDRAQTVFIILKCSSSESTTKFACRIDTNTYSKIKRVQVKYYFFVFWIGSDFKGSQNTVKNNHKFKMANFYAQLKQLIKDCDILFIEPLSYMKHFSNAENESVSTGKIVLLYKNVCISYFLHHWNKINKFSYILIDIQWKGLPSKSPPPPRSKSARTNKNHCDANSSNLLNLTGSPLKDSCQFDLLSESMTEELLLSKQNAWKNDEEQYQAIAMDESQ